MLVQEEDENGIGVERIRRYGSVFVEKRAEKKVLIG